MSEESTTPVQLVMATFAGEDDAKTMLKQLKQEKKEHLISIENAAVIHKNEKGKVKIKETADMGGGKGAAIGAVLGGALVFIFPPAGIGIIPGAILGGLYAKFRDTGFKDDSLKELGSKLETGQSAILVAVHTESVDAVTADLEAASALDIVVTEVATDVMAELEEAVGGNAVVLEEAVVVEEEEKE